MNNLLFWNVLYFRQFFFCPFFSLHEGKKATNQIFADTDNIYHFRMPIEILYFCFDGARKEENKQKTFAQK